MPNLYESLAADPLPPGPRVTNPLAPLLHLLLRVFNVALAALALVLIGAALWMGQAYRHSGDSGGGGGGGGDVPSPSPSPSPSEPDVPPEVPGSPEAAAVLAAAAALGLGGPLLEKAVASFPW